MMMIIKWPYSLFFLVIFYISKSESVVLFNMTSIFKEETFASYRKWEKLNVGTLVECAVHCERDRYCISCLYSKYSRSCVALRSTYEDSRGKKRPIKITGYRLYMTPRPAPTVGSVCDTDADCMTIAYAHCYQGKCRCDIGFSLDTDINRCRELTECQRFSKQFELYKNHMIPGKDRNMFFLISREACLRKCLSVRRYTCRSVDYDKLRTCYSQSVTWLDIKYKKKMGKALYDHYQRQCDW